MDCPVSECFGLEPYEQCGHWSEARRAQWREGKAVFADARRRRAPASIVRKSGGEPEYIAILAPEESVLLLEDLSNVDRTGRRADGARWDARTGRWVKF